MSYGHSHGNANLPTVLAGGKALGLKHGQHLDFNLPKIKNYDLANAGEPLRRLPPAGRRPGPAGQPAA